jgi:hypothetical protein
MTAAIQLNPVFRPIATQTPEYRVQRNQALQLKNHREQMLLAKARGELIERKLVEFQAA